MTVMPAHLPAGAAAHPRSDDRGGLFYRGGYLRATGAKLQDPHLTGKRRVPRGGAHTLSGRPGLATVRSYTTMQEEQLEPAERSKMTIRHILELRVHILRGLRRYTDRTPEHAGVVVAQISTEAIHRIIVVHGVHSEKDPAVSPYVRWRILH